MNALGTSRISRDLPAFDVTVILVVQTRFDESSIIE